jgi:release factor glutamine methyltransferase
MRVKTNKVLSVKEYFRDELKNKYVKEEIENFIFFSFEFYLGYSKTDLILNEKEGLTESELLKFTQVVKQLKQNKPIQYILGETYFYDLKFQVNHHVLIPRPETEELVHWIVNDYKKVINNNLTILDIGTGSGCIAVSIKNNLPNANVYGLDVSEKALNIASINAENNKTHIHFIHDDILNLQNNIDTKFDVIVSNPPYVKLGEKNLMFKNVLDYEPHLALFVEDNDALIFYRAICKFAQSHLNNQGALYFEINEHHGKEMIDLLQFFQFENISLKEDIRGKARMIKAIKK